MNGDTIFLIVCAGIFAAVFFFTRKGGSILPAALTDPGFGGSFEHLDAIAKRQAYKQLGEQYVASRARRMAAEIQEDLPAGPKGEAPRS